MTTSTLGDRLLAVLAKDPCTEGDLELHFPRVTPDAIRKTLLELKREGRAVVSSGVWAARRQAVRPIEGAATPEPAEDDAAPAEAPAVSSARREVGEPDTRICKVCEHEQPMVEFARTGGGGRKKTCRTCSGKAISKGLRTIPARAAAPEPAPASALVDPEPQPEDPPDTDDPPFASVRRTTVLTVRDAFGIIHQVVLNDAGVRAALEALQERAA